MARINWTSLGFTALFALLFIGGLFVLGPQTTGFAVGVLTVVLVAAAVVVGHFFGEKRA